MLCEEYKCTYFSFQILAQPLGVLCLSHSLSFYTHDACHQTKLVSFLNSAFIQYLIKLMLKSILPCLQRDFFIKITNAHTGIRDFLYSEHLKYKYMHVFKIYELMDD